MSSVYYALDVTLNRPAAVKIIDAHFQENPGFTARFLHEARAVASWRHENIIQVYYAGEQDHLNYFAMEYIDGPDLAQILSNYKKSGLRMPYPEVIRFGRAVASALDYAHSRGVIHRDVKPSNVLVSTSGRIVLGDFGLALDTHQGSLGEVFGTALYTAPEQARRSSAAIPQSDLYSLGVMLYEMLTGSVPFNDPSPATVALQQITLPPPPPRRLNPELSEAAETVLLKALSKDPSDRYPSGQDLVTALGQALNVSTESPVLVASTAAQPVGQYLAPPSPSSPAVPISPAGPYQAQPGAWPASQASSNQPRPAIPRLYLLTGCSLALIAPMVILALFISNRIHSIFAAVPPTISSTQAYSFGSTPTPSRSTPISTSTPELFPSPPSTQELANTPTPTSTNSVAGGITNPPSSPSPLPKYINGRKFILYYNDTSFYMYQDGGIGGLIAPAAFERLDSQGNPTNRFDGDAWAEYHSATLGNWCMRIQIKGVGNYLEPAACQDYYLATRFPEPNAPGIFWTPQEGSRQFRVLWGTEEVARCEIAAGTCEVYLP